MSTIKALALQPFLGILVGPVFLNRVAPLVFGLPLLLAWLLLWIVLTSAIMAVIYLAHPANRGPVHGLERMSAALAIIGRAARHPFGGCQAVPSATLPP